LNKVDLFFKTKWAEAQRKDEELKRELAAFQRLAQTTPAQTSKPT
jgi:hypothetical protein